MAIVDNKKYALSGAQIKDLADKIEEKQKISYLYLSGNDDSTIYTDSTCETAATGQQIKDLIDAGELRILYPSSNHDVITVDGYILNVIDYAHDETQYAICFRLYPFIQTPVDLLYIAYENLTDDFWTGEFHTSIDFGTNLTFNDSTRILSVDSNPTFSQITVNGSNPQIKSNGTLTLSSDGTWNSGNHGNIVLDGTSFRPSQYQTGTLNLGAPSNTGIWNNLYMSGGIYHGTYLLTLPNKAGTVAVTDDLPTKVSDLTSDVGGNSYTGTCSTAAATAAKAVTISSDQNFVLNKGAVIGVKFTYTNTAENPTIEVNNTGAKSVWFNTAVITTGSLNRGGYANRYTYYIYDGTYWVWLNWGTDDNTTYSSMSVAEGTAGTATSNRVLRADYLRQIIQSYIPTTYDGSSIIDETITFDKTVDGEFLKLETSTVDPGEGSALDNNTLLAVYDVPDDYIRGEVLVSTQNVDTLATTSDVAAIWSAGTWTQFGRMASSSNKHILTIANPTSNAWVVEVSLDCPSVLPGSVISGSSIITTTPATGIAELDSNNAISKVITWSRIASRGSVYNRKYVTIPANTTKKFCACVCTYQTTAAPTGTWEGGDEITGTAVGAGFGGPSCTLTATLIDNGE